MEKAEARSERKRREILAAARKRFMVEGYASTGMEAVARDAAVSTATLYSYFPSKADLFKVVVDEAGEVFAALLEQTAAAPGDGLSRLRNFTLAYVRFMSDPFVRSVFRLVAAERRRFESVARQFFERAREEFGGTLIRILRDLDKDGVIRVEKPSWAAGQLLGMIEHPTFVVPMLTGDEVKAERPLEAICDEAVETFLARFGTEAVRPLGKKPLAEPRVIQAVSPEL
jgi:AcrR family transcriptional regulator